MTLLSLGLIGGAEKFGGGANGMLSGRSDMLSGAPVIRDGEKECVVASGDVSAGHCGESW